MPEPRILVADVLACLGFFTRLPLPVQDYGVRPFAAAIWAAPVAGIVVGLIGGAVLLCAGWLTLPPAICALLAVAATMAATGALHEDGLSDTVDGFYGGQSRQRRLEIMKDSRIGTFGAAALILSIGMRVAALAAIGANLDALLALVAAHAASRALLPLFIQSTAPARPEGLAGSVGSVSLETAVATLCLGGIVLIPLLGILGGIATAVALALSFLWMRQEANARIGGHTGDVLGAMQQLGEMLVLCAAASAFA